MRVPAVLLILLIAAPAAAQPTPIDCYGSAPHRQFDFWLGQWRVLGADGKHAGDNTITLEEEGCTLREQWTSASGVTGQSLNYYNPATGKWRQLWLDGGYSIIDISGGLQGGAMVLEGDIVYLASGESQAFRGTWTPLADGRVRQFFQQRDAAGNWQTWFDGYYTRKAQPGGQGEG